MIFEELVTKKTSDLLVKKANDVKKTAGSFYDEHPIATCALFVMGAVIFAQRIELRCYQIVTSIK